MSASSSSTMVAALLLPLCGLLVRGHAAPPTPSSRTLAAAPTIPARLLADAPPQPLVAAYEIVAEHPHDPRAYTQGLFWHDGYLYEGTGRYGTSWLRKVDPHTGEVVQQASLESNYFGEGIALLGGRIFQLTWLSQRGFVYDADSFERIEEFSYEGEGWGLTTDGTHLIMSDGTDTLRYLDPGDLTVVRTLAVRANGEPLVDINELEYIGGDVWANVWRSDSVYRIDAETGAVVDRIDFSDLLAGERPRDADAVLNGIAFNPNNGHLFVTGKLWPRIFEVRLVADGRPSR